MNGRRQTPTTTGIEFRNQQAKAAIRFWRSMVTKIDADEQRKERREKGVCPVCFYREGGRVGGARCTSAQCGFCDETLHSGSTAIDVLCQSCAVASGICRQCGADMELKNRRKRELPQPTETRND